VFYRERGRQRRDISDARNHRLVRSRFAGSPEQPDVRAERGVAVSRVCVGVLCRVDFGRVVRHRIAMRETRVEVFTIELRERGKDAARHGCRAALVAAELPCGGTHLVRNVTPAV